MEGCSIYFLSTKTEIRAALLISAGSRFVNLIGVKKETFLPNSHSSRRGLGLSWQHHLHD